MLYAELQKIKNLAKEENNLKEILRSIKKYNQSHGVKYQTYSEEKISAMLKKVQEERSILIAELNDLFTNAAISPELVEKIKLFYISDKSASYISSRLNLDMDNFHRDVKDFLYR